MTAPTVAGLPDPDLRPPDLTADPEPTLCNTCGLDRDLTDGACERCAENGWCASCCAAFSGPDDGHRLRTGDRYCRHCDGEYRADAADRANDAARDERALRGQP